MPQSLPEPTNTQGGVWLPEEAVVELHTGDPGHTLQLVPGVTLEGDGVARVTAGTVARTILRCSRVIAGCGCHGWGWNGNTLRAQLPLGRVSGW